MVGNFFHTHANAICYRFEVLWQSWTSMIGVCPRFHCNYSDVCPPLKTFTNARTHPPTHTHTHIHSHTSHHGFFFSRKFTHNRGHTLHSFHERHGLCLCVSTNYLTMDYPLPLRKVHGWNFFHTHANAICYRFEVLWQSWTSMIGVCPRFHCNYSDVCPPLKTFTNARTHPPHHTHTHTHMLENIYKY